MSALRHRPFFHEFLVVQHGKVTEDPLDLTPEQLCEMHFDILNSDDIGWALDQTWQQVLAHVPALIKLTEEDDAAKYIVLEQPHDEAST